MTNPTPKNETPKNDNAGESAGGAYPNPHSGTSADTQDGGKAFDDDHAGDSGVGYHGGGKAGTKDYAGKD